MELLAELGKGKSLEDFAMIDNKNEDWKYIRFPEDINNFKTSKGESSNSSKKAHIVIRDDNYEVLKEHNDFEIINADSFSEVVIDDYSNRPLDRFVLQQKDKSTSGLVIRTINSSKEPLAVEIQSSGTNAPYIGVIAEKNVTSSIKFLFTETSKGSSYPLIDYKLNSNSQIDTYIVHNTCLLYTSPSPRD